jgi:hypothetical protein
MPRTRSYRCHLLDAKCQIADAVVIDCLDDDAARLRSEEILAARPAFRAIEVWEFDRRVHVHLWRRAGGLSAGSAKRFDRRARASGPP